MREKSRFQQEDTHSRVKQRSGTNNMDGGDEPIVAGNTVIILSY